MRFLKTGGVYCFAVLVALATQSQAATLQDCFDATCRLSSGGGSVGTGMVTAEDGTYYAIITNAHVSGQPNSMVDVEFWKGGKPSSKGRGQTWRTWYARGAWRDIALVVIPKSQVQHTVPVVSFAPKGTTGLGRTIMSIGCSRGAWPSAFKGCVVNQPDSKRVSFVPAPAGGRSGSPLLSEYKPDDWRISGLIAWREGNQGHAMQLGELHNAFDGGAPSGGRPSSVETISISVLPSQYNCPYGDCGPNPKQFQFGLFNHNQQPPQYYGGGGQLPAPFGGGTTEPPPVPREKPIDYDIVSAELRNRGFITRAGLADYFDRDEVKDWIRNQGLLTQDQLATVTSQLATKRQVDEAEQAAADKALAGAAVLTDAKVAESESKTTVVVEEAKASIFKKVLDRLDELGVTEDALRRLDDKIKILPEEIDKRIDLANLPAVARRVLEQEEGSLRDRIIAVAKERISGGDSLWSAVAGGLATGGPVGLGVALLRRRIRRKILNNDGKEVEIEESGL